MVAVIDQLAKLHPNIDISFWCDRGYARQSKDLMQHAVVPVRVSTVFAGKFRRYHGVSIWEQLRDFETIFRNIADILLVMLGFLQSTVKLAVLRPKVVFLKGGFVCLPVGYAARMLRIPIVIHDSDTHPGLTNRLLAPLATAVATGAPLEYYSYPKEKSTFVGIPIREGFHKSNAQLKRKLRREYDLPQEKPVVVVTGGGLGAKSINDAVLDILPSLSKSASVIHVTGTGQYQDIVERVQGQSGYIPIAFVSDEYPLLISGADVVLSRAGASALAELAAVGAVAILIPNKQLVGGHQVTNAKVYTDEAAAVYFDEETLKTQPQRLLTQIETLLKDPAEQQKLSKKLHSFAKPNAARQLAKMIITASEGKNDEAV